MIDVSRMTDTDQNSYVSNPVDCVLATQEQDKKGKYLVDCLAARKYFTPFAVSVDGVVGKEA